MELLVVIIAGGVIALWTALASLKQRVTTLEGRQHDGERSESRVADLVHRVVSLEAQARAFPTHQAPAPPV